MLGRIGADSATRPQSRSAKGNLMRAEGSQTVRRILCVFPRYTPSFGTFEHSYPLTDGVQAFMPPQGLLLIAATCRSDGRSVSSTRTFGRRRARTSNGRKRFSS